MEKSDVQNILAELTNVNLVLLGISITIFTVIYSFLLNKKGDLAQLSNSLNSNSANPYDTQKRFFAINYIKQFSKINGKLLILIIASFSLFLLIFFYNRFFIDYFSSLRTLLFFIFLSLTIFLTFFFVFVFIDIIKKYKKQTAI